MNIQSVTKSGVQLDIELCSALFDKNPDRVIELVSEWLETNRLAPSDQFCIPAYLEAVLYQPRIRNIN